MGRKKLFVVFGVVLFQISKCDLTQESTVPNKEKCYVVFAGSILSLNIFLPL